MKGGGTNAIAFQKLTFGLTEPPREIVYGETGGALTWISDRATVIAKPTTMLTLRRPRCRRVQKSLHDDSAKVVW